MAGRVAGSGRRSAPESIFARLQTDSSVDWGIGVGGELSGDQLNRSRRCISLAVTSPLRAGILGTKRSVGVEILAKKKADPVLPRSASTC